MLKFVILTVIIAALRVKASPAHRDIYIPREYLDDAELKENNFMFAIPKKININDFIELNIKLMENYKRFHIHLYGATSQGLPDFENTYLDLTLDFENEQIYYTIQDHKEVVKLVRPRDFVINDNVVDISMNIRENSIETGILGLCLDSLNVQYESLKKISFLQVAGHVAMVNKLEFHYE